MSIAKLAERMKKDRCPHCGVKHAADGCGCTDRRYAQPRQGAMDSERRRPATDYPPAKQASEIDKLREKIAAAPLAAVPAIAGATARMAPALMRAAAPTAKNLGMQAASGAAMQGGMNLMAPGPPK